jgi:hypothetical protein
MSYISARRSSSIKSHARRRRGSSAARRRLRNCTRRVFGESGLTTLIVSERKFPNRYFLSMAGAAARKPFDGTSLEPGTLVASLSVLVSSCWILRSRRAFLSFRTTWFEDDVMVLSMAKNASPAVAPPLRSSLAACAVGSSIANEIAAAEKFLIASRVLSPLFENHLFNCGGC